MSKGLCYPEFFNRVPHFGSPKRVLDQLRLCFRPAKCALQNALKSGSRGARTSPWRPPTTAVLRPPIRLITSINTTVTKKTLHLALLWPQSCPLLPSICHLSVGVAATPLDAMAMTATEYATFTRLQQPPHTALCNKCDLRSSAAFPRCTSSLHSRHQNEAKLNFFSANFGSAFS